MNPLTALWVSTILLIRYVKRFWVYFICLLVLLGVTYIAFLKFQVEEYRTQPSKEEIEYYENGKGVDL